MAWETFGAKNGTATLNDLVSAIARYRTDEIVTPATFIVCRVLVEPVFLPELLWFDLPESWSANIVSGKKFDGDTAEGRSLWRRLEEAAGVGPLSIGVEESERFGQPVLVQPRLGQGAFRVAITELYSRQCALTGGKVLPALDAAHIRPYSEGGVHAKPNGILLRKDIHSVFDAGYATIDPDYRFVVSEKVRDVFNNGNEYRRLHGSRMWLPQNARDQPDREALRWHNDNRFLG
jgi:putative restriction endonuclease